MYKLKAIAHIFSAFSVILSLSVVVELYKSVHNKASLILFSSFIVSFLVANEIIKVMNLRAKFNKRKYSRFALIFTFCASFLFSGTGIYFWVSKSAENRDQSLIALKNNQFKIKNLYAQKVDSVSNIGLQSTTYDNYLINLDFWKNRICRTDSERMQARGKIVKIEKDIKELENAHQLKIQQQIERLQNLQEAALANLDIKHQTTENNNEKNDFLFGIFFCMVAATELLIVYIQYYIADIFTDVQKKNLKVLYNILQQKTDIISLDQVRYDFDFNPQHSEDKIIRKKAVDLRHFYGDLGIIDKDPEKKGLILTSNKKAYKILESYYQKINVL